MNRVREARAGKRRRRARRLWLHGVPIVVSLDREAGVMTVDTVPPKSPKLRLEWWNHA